VLALFLIGFGIVALLVIGGLLALVLWWLSQARDGAEAQPEVAAATYEPPET
jgi:type II secretory pathway pseudopilin PulG